MTIHVERDGDVAVAQQFLYDLYRYLHRHQDGGSAMPEVMKTHVRQARLLHQRGEEFIEAGGIQESAVDVTEHEIVFFPGWPGLQLCF